MSDQQRQSVQLLREEFLQRQKKNSSYSLRSFAQALEISPSYLSFIFQGKRRIAHKVAVRIVRKLQWSRSRQKYFLALVEFETTKSEKDKENLLAEVQKWARLGKQKPSLEADQFAMIAEWEHSALLAILNLPNFVGKVEIMAQRLNLSTATVEMALQRLQRLNLVSRNGRNAWEATHQHLEIKATPSPAIRAYHKEVLRKALVAIDKVGFEERDFSNFIVTVDKKNVAEAKKRIFSFQQEMSEILEGKNPSQVYQLSVQLFRVDQDKE